MFAAMEAFDAARFMQAAWTQSRPFEQLAVELWAYQLQHNPLLNAYQAGLPGPRPLSLPISFFKHKGVQTGIWEPAAVFASSGTTGQSPSHHYVQDLDLYQANCLHGFRYFFPNQPFRILALLPSYLERGNSSLVQMVKTWIDAFGLPGSGFYLHDFSALRQAIAEGGEAGERLLLIGVTFALLDFVAEEAMQLPPDTLVMETGGMKGRKEEMVRTEIHRHLKQGFGVDHIYSEYGMTELLSQAYTGREGRFWCPPTLQVRNIDLNLPT